MAGAAIVIDVREVAELGRALRAASKASLAPLMDAIAGAGEEATIARIDAGGPAPDGSDWPARHPRNPNPHPLLNLEGGLVDSLESEAGAETAVWGSSLVYARIHQLGGTIVPREAPALRFMVPGQGLIHASQVTIPARPYLGYGADERRGVEDVIEAWLEQELGDG